MARHLRRWRICPTETGPSLFSALQDKLGLKLVAQKEQMDVIVIDHIEQPSPN